MKDLGERFAAEVPELTERTVGAIEAQMPQLAARLDRGFLRAGVALTNERFADGLRGRLAPHDGEAHVELGAWLARSGVSLAALGTAYRLGAGLAWEVLAGLATEQALSAPASLELATRHVGYVDRLSSDSLAGYERAAEQAGALLARERQLLLEAVLRGEREISRAASAARWPVPGRLRAGVLLAPVALPRAVLAGRAGEVSALLVPADLLLPADTPVALGSVVALPEAGASLSQARRLAALAGAGHLPGDALLLWEDHLPALVVHADPAAAEALARRRLAPMDELGPVRRAAMAETLAAWLDTPGQPLAMARRLHLHPQTVRYRIARLRERFGDAIDDPAARFELGLALRIAAPRG